VYAKNQHLPLPEGPLSVVTREPSPANAPGPTSPFADGRKRLRLVS